MIISHTHKFIFFAVPKTGTHAVREVLRTHLSRDDWEQQMLTGNQKLPIPEIAEIGHGHITVREIRPYLSQEIWSEYHKFAFIRNPFDRFISVCAFLNRENPAFAKSPLAWMKEALSRPRFRERVLVREQFEQLCNEEREIGVDSVGRYESLQESLDAVLGKLSLPSSPLSVLNSSEHKAYSEYYDEELKGLVQALYSTDIEEFNYAF